MGIVRGGVGSTKGKMRESSQGLYAYIFRPRIVCDEKTSGVRDIDVKIRRHGDPSASTGSPTSRLAGALLCRMCYVFRLGRQLQPVYTGDEAKRLVVLRVHNGRTRAWEQTRPSYSTGTRDGTRSRMPDGDAFACVHGECSRTAAPARRNVTNVHHGTLYCSL